MSVMSEGLAGAFSRVERMFGDSYMKRLAGAKIIIFGVGGVGSWCAESLVRTGVRNITLVDADRVAASNINRQAMALCSTVGEVKTEAMAERLIQINPSVNVECINELYSADTAEKFALDSYDYVVDAIDSLADKAHLILRASASSSTFFSSMGAALKSDPTQVAVAEFWKVAGCPLAAALRKRFRASSEFPSRKFKCVFSPERLTNLGSEPETDAAMSFGKVAYNGAICAVTATFGFTLSSLIIRDLMT